MSESFEEISKIFYTISALIFIIGALVVYSKIAKGEDMLKAIVAWLSAALACGIFPFILKEILNSVSYTNI